MRVPDLSPREIINTLSRFGWEVVREGKRHVIVKHVECPELISIPRHARVKRGTLGAILKIAGISLKSFLANM